MHNPRPNVRVGTCGFAVAQATQFAELSAVELDTTFYNLPRAETAARWRAAAPSSFVFCLKAWQLVTHPASSPTYRRTRLGDAERSACGHFGFNPTVRWAWDRTLEIAAILGAPVILLQSPPSFRPTKDHLARLRIFFERAKRGRQQLAWEPRGDWSPALVQSLCQELDLLAVLDPFQVPPVNPRGPRYYRLHGLRGANHRFTDGELAQLERWCGARGATYCFFNNRWRWSDARRLSVRLGLSRPRSA